MKALTTLGAEGLDSVVAAARLSRGVAAEAGRVD
jgi:hypothetical protein